MSKVVSSLFKSSVFKGLLRGMGSAAVAAVGWKLASDVYDVVKSKVTKRSSAEPGEEEEERD